MYQSLKKHPNNVPKNAAANYLSICASVIFWIIYYLAYGLIMLAGLTIIFGVLRPDLIWYWLNHLLDQYHIERHFKDEL